MERHDIVPKSIHDAEKRKIRAALTTQKSIASRQSEFKEAPDFFKDLEEKFINQLTEMGFDYTDIKDLIEDKGLPELNTDFAIDSMNKKDSYMNPLYVKPNAAEASISYAYHDPMSMPPISHAVGKNFGPAFTQVKPG